MPNGYVSVDSNDDAQWNIRTNGVWAAVVRGICYGERAVFRLFLHLSRYISLYYTHPTAIQPNSIAYICGL